MTTMPLGLSGLLAWRFSRSRRNKGFLSFISMASSAGLVLGVFALIVVLSVMNGFERELKNRLLSVVPHAELVAANKQMLMDWPQQIEQLKQHPQIVAASPVIKIETMARKGKLLKAIELRGIDTQLELTTSGVAQYVAPEQWQSLDQQANNIVLGRGVLQKLKLKVGDSVTLLIAKHQQQSSFKSPRAISFNITGEFAIGGQLDYALGYVSLATARRALGVDDGVQGIRLKVDDVFQASNVVREVGMRFPHHVYLHSWMITQGHLYKDIELVRVVMYLALSLVIAVASFNIVSTLVMTVHEKRREIAILKTMGASNKLIVFAFVLQGFFTGVIGISIGVIAAVICVLHLPDWYQLFERLSGQQFLQQDVYFISFLPTELVVSDVVITASIALCLSVISTLYPAYKAANLQPASVLGH